MRTPARLLIAGGTALALVLSACSTPSAVQASGPRDTASAPSTTPAPTPATTTPATPTPATTAATSAAATTAAATRTPSAARSSTASVPKATTHPVIVIDPGHSPTIHAIDKRTGLNVSDYENEPEMRNVFSVALLVRAQLLKAGYRVVMTKKHVRSRVSLAQRAYIANRAHAALALSIHDQAGAHGGIGFRAGNNTVYYQSVGTYRATPSGKRIYFRNKALARISKRYGKIFRSERERVERTHVNLMGNTGYNLGSRGLAAGDIWIVQLLSTVPWIYNESGGNSAGRVGLSHADERTYAASLVAAVERCVPIRR